MSVEKGLVLVVDDEAFIRDILARQLKLQGHTVIAAENGRRALEMMQEQAFDLLLLDILMPEMDGYQVLEQLKADPALRHIPVIVISALGQLNSVVRCIELGAEDYMIKPFDRVLLKARVDASLERKHLRDQEQAHLAQLEAEREKSERLLLNILPGPIAEQLKREQRTIADRFEEVTVLFCDIVDFSTFWSQRAPGELVDLLNDLFSVFDRLAERHGLEKIKTIGDAYMVVGGLPTPRPDHAEAIAEMALDIWEQVAQFNAENGESIRVRMGIDTGPVVAGVIGRKKFIYDLWGDAVNTAFRMQEHGLPDHIQVTEAMHRCLRDKYLMEERGAILVKGKDEMITYFLTGRRE
jgi:class 3 adenylate cyclase